MLRINASRNISATLNYFKDDLTQQDYYAGQSKCVGTWHGKLKEPLGLGDEVEEEQFRKIIHNRHPLTNEKITVRDSARRRGGYDFTFNAPKSVSVLHAVNKDEAILKSHRQAVALAMEEVEANMQTQVWEQGEKRYKTTSNLVYAAFEHYLTRPVEHNIDGEKQYIPDCHLHTHAFVMNATWNEDKNRYQAVEIGNIKRSGIYYEAVYQNHLAKGLEAAGYAVERSKHGFEVAGVSQSIRERFSNRTKEINLKALEKGIVLDSQKDQLGARTRVKKQKSVDESVMEAHWMNRLSEEEKQDLRQLKGRVQTDEGKQEGQSVDAAIDRALLHYMERKSAVPEKQVIGYALKLGVEKFSVEDIQQAMERRKNKDIITGQQNSDTYLTTREAWLAEHQMKDFAVRTRHQFEGINPDYTPQRDFLNKGQRDAIQHTLSSEDQVIIVAGGAGVGKTTLMQEVKSGVEAGNKKLFAFAPSAEASRGVLRDKGFEGAETIQKFLLDSNLQEQTKNQVILIDEAGMIGNKTMNDLFKVAEKQNCRVILSGDWKQHTSVESGDALRLLEKDTKLPVSRVNEVVRQKDQPIYKQAVRDLSDGKLEQAFEKLDNMGSIVEIEEQTERHERIAQDYLDSITSPGIREKDGKYRNRTALVVSPTHAEGQAVTGVIRNKLKEKGLVDKEEQSFTIHRGLSWTAAEKQDHLNYREGMAIHFYKENGSYKKDEHYQVAAIQEEGKVLVQTSEQAAPTALPLDAFDTFEVFHKEQVKVAKGDLLRITNNGKSLENAALNNGECHNVEGFTANGDIRLSNKQTISKDYHHFNLGYYRTSHSSQGRDADDVFIAQSISSFPATNQKQHYVSVSRGIERCFIYTDNREELKWAVSKDANRMSADEILRKSKDQSAALLKEQLKQQQQYMARKQLTAQTEQFLPFTIPTKYESQHQSLARVERTNAGDFNLHY